MRVGAKEPTRVNGVCTESTTLHNKIKLAFNNQQNLCIFINANKLFIAHKWVRIDDNVASLTRKVQ